MITPKIYNNSIIVKMIFITNNNIQLPIRISTYNCRNDKNDKIRVQMQGDTWMLLLLSLFKCTNVCHMWCTTGAIDKRTGQET